MSDEILEKLKELQAGQAKLEAGQSAILEELGQLRTENGAMMEAITALGKAQQSTNDHVVRIGKMLSHVGLRQAS